MSNNYTVLVLSFMALVFSVVTNIRIDCIEKRESQFIDTFSVQQNTVHTMVGVIGEMLDREEKRLHETSR